jgi:phage recombination protein Bet
MEAEEQKTEETEAKLELSTNESKLISGMRSWDEIEKLDKSIALAIRAFDKGQSLNMSKEEMQLAYYHIQKTKLDFLSRQIYTFRDKKLGNKLVWILSIDGFRLIAERTGKYIGQEGPFWVGEDGVWRDFWPFKNELPIACKVNVIKVSVIDGIQYRETVPGVAHDYEFNKGFSTWQKIPIHMLSKVAESHALRKAFPQELSGYYSEDEDWRSAEEKKGNYEETNNGYSGPAISTLSKLKTDTYALLNTLGNRKQDFTKTNLDEVNRIGKMNEDELLALQKKIIEARDNDQSIIAEAIEVKQSYYNPAQNMAKEAIETSTNEGSTFKQMTDVYESLNNLQMEFVKNKYQHKLRDFAKRYTDEKAKGKMLSGFDLSDFIELLRDIKSKSDEEIQDLISPPINIEG